QAGRLFLFACLSLLFLGMIALRRSLLGRVGWMPLAVLPFLYSYPVSLGLLSYVFSIGAALLLFAGWIALRDRPIARLAVGLLGGVIVTLCHLFGFGVYALLGGAYELGRPQSLRLANARRWAIYAAQLIPSALILLHAPPPDAATTASLDGGPAARVMALMSPLLFNMNAFDKGCFVACCLLAIAAVRLRVGRLAPAALMPVLVLLAVSLAMPVQFRGVWGLHVRLPLVALLVLLAGFEPAADRRRWGALVLAGLVAVAAVRGVAVDREMRACTLDIEEFRAALPIIKDGSRVVLAAEPLGLEPTPCLTSRHPGIGILTVTDRHAYVPQFFTTTRIVSFTPPYATLWPPAAFIPSRAALLAASHGTPLPGDDELRNWESTADYLVWFRTGSPDPLLPQRLDLLRRGSFFDIYRVKDASTIPGRD
ncbi:MAG TPA: hypothetical protein VK558_01090, partial [Patescibacteria group bacterium]|nr:hypothetical protein [Patescibacteria group bacterium]